MVVVGSLNTDLALTVRTVPGPGETVLGGGPSYRCGGKGANQAMAAARSGATVRMVGCVGSDAGGEQLLAELSGAGVDVDTVRTVDGPSGLAVVVVAEDGENMIIVVPGANAACTRGVITAGLATLTPADVVVAQGEIPVEAIAAAAGCARRAGARFVLNLAPPVAVDLVPGAVQVLVVNEHEAAELAGSHDGRPERCARELADRLDATVVITLGADGILLADRSQLIRLPAYVPNRVVDTTGAGDAFVGAMVAALAAGQPLEIAVRWGAAAGSITVESGGAQSTDLSAARIEQVLAAAEPVWHPRSDDDT